MNDQEVLEILYDRTGGPKWNARRNWMTEAPLEDWEGVLVDEAFGNVLRLDLSHNNLTGEIPAELGQLGMIERLDLADNELSGWIPAELLQPTGLQQIYLQNNRLTGEIPEHAGGLNDLEGPIPAWLGLCPNLRGIWASGCGLSGEIPAELAQAGSLTHLDPAHKRAQRADTGGPGADGPRALCLEGNLFKGGIPEGLWKTAQHDLEQAALDVGQELTGHLLDFSAQEGWVSIETCPEWPSRTIRMRLRWSGLLRDRLEPGRPSGRPGSRRSRRSSGCSRATGENASTAGHNRCSGGATTQAPSGSSSSGTPSPGGNNTVTTR